MQTAKQIKERMDKLGDWLTWEPETIRYMLRQPDEVLFNKVMAIQTVLTTQLGIKDGKDVLHFDNWPIFEKIVIAINGTEPDFSEIEQATPFEISSAIHQLEEMTGYKATFSEDVAKYVAASYMANEIVHCPFWPEVDVFLEPEDDLKKSVRMAWKARSKIDLDKEHPVVIQLRRLVEIAPRREMNDA